MMIYVYSNKTIISRLILFLFLCFNTVMTLEILLGYLVFLDEELGGVGDVVTLDEDLRARLPVWGRVVACTHREVHLALVSKLLGVDLKSN